jgi:integrase
LKTGGKSRRFRALAIPSILRALIKPSTRNHYLAIAKTAYGFAVKRGKLKENPLKTYEKEKETARDRVWTADEKKAIFEVLEKRKSHLYWLVYFSAMNPIRRGDLVALKRENFYYNQFNPSRSYIHFIPQKTEGCKPQEAQLICLDKALLDYFQALPAECPLLFPRFDVDGELWHLPVALWNKKQPNLAEFRQDNLSVRQVL